MREAADIKQRLEKKGTFEQALSDLRLQLQAPREAEQLQQLLPLVTRTHTLLKTRYSNIAFWKQGQHLFETCRVSPVPALPAW